MKVSDFIKLAKKAQSTLRAFDYPAEHIYLIGYSESHVVASLVFVSEKYNGLSLYDRTQLATAIQKGPFKYNFYVLGTDHLSKTTAITSDQLYRAVKIYGRTPLMLGGVEYASQQDANFNKANTNTIAV